jgi:hypothetical protein
LQIKLLAAHIAAFAVCVAAPAPPGRESSAYDAAAVYDRPLACNQISGLGQHYPIGEPLSQPVAITCVDPLPDLNIVPVPEIAPGEPEAELAIEPAKDPLSALQEIPAYAEAAATVASRRPRPDEPDTWLMAACGVLSLALGSLRFKEGRKRHRPGAKKSRVELRMMA